MFCKAVTPIMPRVVNLEDMDSTALNKLPNVIPLAALSTSESPFAPSVSLSLLLSLSRVDSDPLTRVSNSLLSNLRAKTCSS